jgi:protein STE50
MIPNLSTSYAIPSPTSPVPTITTNNNRDNSNNNNSRVYDDNPFPAGMFGSSGTSSSSQTTPKSFRVAMDDPCEKVLPAALRRYNIQADWRQYSLYIVYGDQERCLELHEKPLKMFKDLDREGKKPMFMLRRKAVDGLQPGGGMTAGAGTGITLGLPGGIL